MVTGNKAAARTNAHGSSLGVQKEMDGMPSGWPTTWHENTHSDVKAQSFNAFNLYPQTNKALTLMTGRVRKLVAFDATALALQAGSALALNVVMLGALAKSGAIPLSPDLLQQTIEQKTKKQQVEVNVRAFRMGLQTV